MKTFSEYTDINNHSIRESSAPQYTLFPKDKEELKKMIEEEINAQGNEADLNHIDVSKITDFSGLFLRSRFCGDISSWDVSNATTMKEIFQHSEFNGDISDWDVSNVTDMESMFLGCKSFNQDLSG